MANIITDLRNCSRSFLVYASTARTVTPDTQEFEGLGRKAGLIVVVDVTAVTSTPSVDFKVQGVDRVSGKTWDIATKTAVATTGTTVFQIHPAVTVDAPTNKVSAQLPPVIRITATHGNANSITYSVVGYLTY